jgi:hypothetical protein
MELSIFKQFYFTCCYKLSLRMKYAQILSFNGRPSGRRSAACAYTSYIACCR